MNKNGKISASMMCSSLGKLSDTIHLFEEENIDYLHIDVMDGNFVTNMGYGTSYVKHMRDVTDIPLDIHLMITNPEYKLEWFDLQPTDIVSIHAESTQDIFKGAIEAVKSYGCKCTVAINPITPIDVLEEVYTMADGVNILHVTPGFAGQKAVEGTVEKTGTVIERIKSLGLHDYIIEVDGNITFERAKILRDLGANMFVAGSSSIFKGDISDYRDNIRELRKSII